MPLKLLKEKLQDFWCKNIKKNYKKISIALGTLIITVSQYVLMRYLSDMFPGLDIIWDSVFIFITVFSVSFFGKQEDGIDGKMPSTKEINMVIEKFPNVAKSLKDVQTDSNHIKRVLECNTDLRRKFNEFLDIVKKEQEEILKEEFK